MAGGPGYAWPTAAVTWATTAGDGTRYVNYLAPGIFDWMKSWGFLENTEASAPGGNGARTREGAPPSRRHAAIG